MRHVIRWARPEAKLLIVLALGGGPACASPEAPPPATPAAMDRPTQPAPACRTALLPLEGLSVCMPAEPEERRSRSERNGVHGLSLSIDAGAGHRAELSAFRLRFLDAKAPFIKISPPDAWTRVDASREIEVDGHPGLDVEGLSKPATHTHARIVAVGDSLYVAEVERPLEARVDPRVVESFLGSLHVEVPWRIHASPEDRYTVAVPEPAVLEATTRPVGNGNVMKVASFGMGGKEARIFMVIVTPLPPGDTRSADQVMDDAVRSFAGQAGNTILETREISPADLRGREILGRGAEGLLRMQVIVAPGRFYLLGVSAKQVEGVAGAGVERFFDSLQIAPL